MEEQVIFWFLVAIAIMQVLAIIVIGRAIKSVLRSDFFMKRMKEKINAGGKLTLSIVALLISSTAFAQGDPENPFHLEVSTNLLYSMGAVNVALFMVIMYFKGLLKNLIESPSRAAQAEVIEQKPSFIQRTLHALTDTVPISEEFKVETDHEYDGIRELDNNLPPWWKWGFYVSIAAGVIYLMNFHVLKTGDLQEEAYEKSIAQAEIEIQEYLAAQAMNVDEKNVVFVEDVKALNRGKGLFTKYCQVCHGAEGEGKVGPNLCDEYWLYGGSINDVFATIKYGAKNGMKSWKDELNPIQIQELASFVKTFEGTTPANPKAPQGEIWVNPLEMNTDSIPAELSAAR